MTIWLSSDTGWLNGVGWATWVAVAVSMLVLWGLTVAIVAALTPTGAPRSRATAGPGPLQVLNERFARVEIDEAEYQQRSADSDPHPHPHPHRTVDPDHPIGTPGAPSHVAHHARRAH